MRIFSILITTLTLLSSCATTSPDKTGPVIKEGLPGGGNGFCCYHAGTSPRLFWHVGETSPGGVLLTSSNIGGLCATGQLPVRVGCAAGQ